MTAIWSHERQRRAELRRAGTRGGPRAAAVSPCSLPRPCGPLRPGSGSLAASGSRGAGGPDGRPPRVAREAAGGPWASYPPRPVFFFLPLGGGGWGRSKMAAAFPRRWGMGAESNFAVALLRSRAAAILGSRAGRAARSTKWRSRRGSWRPGPAASPVLQGKVRRSHVGLGVGRVHGWRRAGLSGASGHGNGARGGVGGPDGFVLGRFLRGRGLNWGRTQGH